MPLIIGAKSATATYTVDNSCRFNPGDDPTLTIASLGTPTDQNKWTFSAWVKRGKAAGYAIESGVMRMYADDNDCTTINVNGAGQMEFDNKVSSSFDGRRKTSAAYLDPAAWYHYVMVYDSDNVTGDDRMITYVNGTRITALDTDSDPGSGTQSGLGSGNTMTVGIGGASGTSEWGGYLAEVALCDGQAYAASDFGEFDGDSPTIWKPKKISGLTFGDNGFYLDFKDSADLGADVSGNSNDFTVANLDATDQATDTPTNNFAVMNVLNPQASGYTIENGNLSINGSATDTWRSVPATLGVSSGKWYWETEVTSNNTHIGMMDYDQVPQSNAYAYQYSRAYMYKDDGDKANNGVNTAYGDAFVTGDIIGVALDLDNGKIYWSVDGVWQDSGDPESGATGTGSAFDITSGYTYTPISSTYEAADVIAYNFGGCPAFTVSSGNADGDGYGNFEYAPPSGYYALCTKNLGAYGG